MKREKTKWDRGEPRDNLACWAESFRQFQRVMDFSPRRLTSFILEIVFFRAEIFSRQIGKAGAAEFSPRLSWLTRATPKARKHEEEGENEEIMGGKYLVRNSSHEGALSILCKRNIHDEPLCRSIAYNLKKQRSRLLVAFEKKVSYLWSFHFSR